MSREVKQAVLYAQIVIAAKQQESILVSSATIYHISPNILQLTSCWHPDLYMALTTAQVGVQEPGKTLLIEKTLSTPSSQEAAVRWQLV